MTTEQGLTALKRLRAQLRELLAEERPDQNRARMLGEYLETARAPDPKNPDVLREYKAARSMLAKVKAKAA